MAVLNPYLSFRDSAREAMEFYQSVLGGELTVSTFGEFGQADTPIADLIMHSQLETAAGFTLMGSDTPPGMEYAEGASISISLSGNEVELLRGYFAGLSAGGVIVTPLEVQMWGDEFGMFTDKFGINWLVNIASA